MSQPKTLLIEADADIPESRVDKLCREFGAARLRSDLKSGFLLSLHKITPHRLSSLDSLNLSLETDFLSGEFKHRLKTSGKHQPLAKALGIPKGVSTILDLTGGLGGDGMVLAACGARVTMLERDPVLHFLLDEAIKKANKELPWISERMTLLKADAWDYLARLENLPEAIYYDPMYPEQDKSALPRKEMQLLKLYLGADDDSDENESQLLASAISKSRRRVVVKRPAGAPQILPNVSLTIDGSTTRFDLYLK